MVLRRPHCQNELYKITTPRPRFRRHGRRTQQLSNTVLDGCGVEHRALLPQELQINDGRTNQWALERNWHRHRTSRVTPTDDVVLGRAAVRWCLMSALVRPSRIFLFDLSFDQHFFRRHNSSN